MLQSTRTIKLKTINISSRPKSIPHHITSHHITSHHITSHHITSHHITTQHVTLHSILSHGIATRLTSSHLMILSLPEEHCKLSACGSENQELCTSQAIIDKFVFLQEDETGGADQDRTIMTPAVSEEHKAASSDR